MSVFFICVFIGQLSSQKIPLYFESYTTENGLPQNLIGKIIQDKTGFIWLSTRDGLSRFDGYDFVNFKHEIADTNSLPADFLTDIVVDSNNGLWIATFGKGLTHYNQEQNHFTRLNDDYDTSAGSLQEILSLYIDKTNYLWIGTTKGLFRSKTNINSLLKDTSSINNKFFEYTVTGEKQKIQCIYEDRDNTIWACSDKGLFKITQKNNRYKQLAINKLKTRVNDITEFNKDYLLLGTDNGLYKYDKRTGESENILKTKIFADYNANLKVDRILSDNAGNFWIGTYESGLLYYNPKESIVYQYTNDISDEHSIRANMISALFVDKSTHIIYRCPWKRVKCG